ncbi:MAG TPA: monofunctional biosynthetic peptidoglycan transglycosylase [Burkholderiales bacterium]|nr:monofunctional biosynthetic peptidoglycan transglycosylase [Burkholderiales bacterium]
MLKTLLRWLSRGGAVLVAAVFIYQLWFFLHVWFWVRHNPENTAFMEVRMEDLQSKNPHVELKHVWVPYSRISPQLKRALIAAEDAKFLEHEGFDWEGIEQAYEKNIRKGKIVAGGSTISQQLAKNLFLSSNRTPWRKAEEALITMMLEFMMDKKRILEIYLNTIEWGNGIFGAEAAARHYYGVSAAELSREQAARLAAMVPKPRFYDRHRNTSWLNSRTEIILERMNTVEVP